MGRGDDVKSQLSKKTEQLLKTGLYFISEAQILHAYVNFSFQSCSRQSQGRFQVRNHQESLNNDVNMGSRLSGQASKKAKLATKDDALVISLYLNSGKNTKNMLLKDSLWSLLVTMMKIEIIFFLHLLQYFTMLLPLSLIQIQKENCLCTMNTVINGQ